MQADSARTTLVFGPTGRIGWALLNELHPRVRDERMGRVVAIGRSIPEIAAQALPSIEWRSLPGLFQFDRELWRGLAREFGGDAPLSIINLVARNPVDATDGIAPEITAEFLASNALLPALVSQSFDRARIVNVSSIARYELNLRSGQSRFAEDDLPTDPEILEFASRWTRRIEQLADAWMEGGLDRETIRRRIVEALGKDGYQLPPGIRAYGASKLMQEMLRHENQTSLILTDVYGLFDPGRLLAKTAGAAYSPLAASVVSGPLQDLLANRPVHLDFGPNPSRQTVDLIHMPDVLSLLWLVASECASAFPEGRYNLTTGESLTPRDLAGIFEELKRAVGSSSRITCCREPVEQRFRFDPSRLKRRLREQGLEPFEPTPARDGMLCSARAYAALLESDAA